jgi:transposase
MAATKQEKASCVLDYAQCKSVTTVQRNFRRRFGKDPPTRKSIYDWHRKFEATGCLCKGKSPGRPRVSEENVQRIRQAFLRSPKKSIPKASRELQIPQTTVWKVLRKHLRLKQYKLQLVQALKATQFCSDFQAMLDENDFVGKVVFSDETTFHFDGKLNCLNCRIWGTENSHVMVEQERDSSKVNMFCAISLHRLYGQFFFTDTTIAGDTCLEMLLSGSCLSLQKIRRLHLPARWGTSPIS